MIGIMSRGTEGIQERAVDTAVTMGSMLIVATATTVDLAVTVVVTAMIVVTKIEAIEVSYFPNKEVIEDRRLTWFVWQVDHEMIREVIGPNRHLGRLVCPLSGDCSR